jgi:hypothetical protein
MSRLLDGPAKQTKVSVGTGTAVEVKVGASSFTDRQAITIQPTGKLKVYFADEGETPSAATVAANGFIHFKDAKETYEAGPQQKVFIVSDTGTIDVVVCERA